MHFSSFASNSYSSTPLYSTFATPFSIPGTNNTPLAIPDFTLPAAYKVQNVPPLHSKIGNMSDEALLAVFYTMTRDIAQELAAQELYGRDWRWHMKLQLWLSKDPQNPHPIRINNRQERGTYIVFNEKSWRKERVSFSVKMDFV
jgi:CCR4-NOT transcription complex subunit 2